MKKKQLLRRWVFLTTILAAVFIVLRLYQGFLLSPLNDNDSRQRQFIIPKGQSVMEVAKRLEGEGFIRSANAFTILVRISGKHIQAGEFELSSSMSAEEILEEVVAGKAERRVTLLEGWRVEEMAEKLEQELGIKKEDFVKTAKEGYMFPDTYYFEADADVSRIVEVMRGNFDNKYSDALRIGIKNQGLTMEEGVILASIVEREGRSDEVRRMIAGILLKRYKIGMGLNADATVQYALGYQDAKKNPPAGGWWKRHLSKDDLKIDSLYNTYIHQGLPPTPIASPGLSSLKAVADANPHTPYLYYYHDSQGRSYYGKTLEEHNDNVALYP